MERVQSVTLMITNKPCAAVTMQFDWKPRYNCPLQSCQWDQVISISFDILRRRLCMRSLCRSLQSHTVRDVTVPLSASIGNNLQEVERHARPSNQTKRSFLEGKISHTAGPLRGPVKRPSVTADTSSQQSQVQHTVNTYPPSTCISHLFYARTHASNLGAYRASYTEK